MEIPMEVFLFGVGGGGGAAEVYPLLPVLLDLKGKGLCETNAGAGETKCLNQ